MKTRIISLIVVLSLFLSLFSACGIKNQGKEDVREALEYTVKFTGIYATTLSYNGGAIYIEEPKKYGNVVPEENRIFKLLDRQLNEVQKIECEVHSDDSFIVDIAASPYGGFWAYETSLYGEQEKQRVNYYNDNGDVQLSIRPLDFGIPYFSFLHANQDGLYIAYGYSLFNLLHIALIDMNGDIASKWESVFDSPSRMTTLDDGRTLLLDSFIRVFELKEEGSAEYICTLEDGSNYFGAGIGNELYLNIQQSMYRFSLDTKEMEEIAYWGDLMTLPGIALCGLIVFSEDDIIGLLTSNQLVRFEKSEGLSLAADNRKVVRIAFFGADPFISYAIADFNAKNDTYKMEIKDYAQYNTASDPYGGALQLNLDIAAGRVPDLFFWGSYAKAYGFNAAFYISQGLFADMYDFIDMDDDFSRETFIPNILTAAEASDGRLYDLPIEFIVSVIACDPSVITLDSWTINEFLQELERHEKADLVFGTAATPESLLFSILSNNWDEYIDWQTSMCNFKSESFIKLLEFFKRPAGDPFDFMFPHEAIAAGRQLLVDNVLSDVSSIQKFTAVFQGDVHFIGYPTSHGSGNTIDVNRSMSISSVSEYKELLWEFIKPFYTKDFQLESIYLFPVNKEAMEERLTHPADFEEDGASIGYMSPDGAVWQVVFTDATPEEATQVRELIYSLDRVRRINYPLYYIIMEEAVPFLAGDKSAAETARIIQDRVQNYVSEQNG